MDDREKNTAAMDGREQNAAAMDGREQNAAVIESGEKNAAVVKSRENLTVEQAVEQMLLYTRVLNEVEEVPLLQASGRILARDQKAEFDNPPFNRSPIDGYACRSEDIQTASADSPAKLTVVEEIDAGDWSERTIAPGQAVRIMTGAAIPAGCDCCIRQEDTDYGEDIVHIYKAEKAWSNYCYQGEDFHAGTVLLEKGTRIGYVEIGVLASMGQIRVPVLRRPRVVLLTSGDEVVEPGRPLPPGKIYNSNQSVLAARLMEFGIEPYQIAWISDDAAEMASALQKATTHADLIITTGAVSVGKKDIMHEALRLAGAERIFWRVKMKPGMPTLFSVCQNVPVISLSGNPFGVAVSMELLVRPVLGKLTQDSTFDLEYVSGIMASTFSKGGKGRRFVRARWKDGRFYLPDGLHSNGVLASMAGCNCLLDLPAGTPPLTPGDHAEGLLL